MKRYEPDTDYSPTLGRICVMTDDPVGRYVEHVRLVRDDGSGGELNFKHRVLRPLWSHGRNVLTATDWQGMVREAIGILEGER